MATGINVSDIVAEFGSYYKNNGQNRQSIYEKLFQTLETEKVMTQRTTENTVLELSSAEIDDILQTFQIGWTPKGSTKFKPVEIPLQHFKVDYELQAYAIVNTWLDFLRDNKLDPKKFPLTKYILNEHIIPKIHDGIELKEIFHGEPSSPTAGTANATGETMNGLKKQIIDGVNADRINKIDLNAITSSNVVAEVEKFVDNIDQLYRSTPMNVCMSHDLRKMYYRDKREEGHYQIPGPEGIDDTIDFTPQKIQGLPSMFGSKIIWATPKWNILSVKRRNSNEGKFEMQADKRVVNIFSDFYRGVGFIIPELVWAYVPDDELGSGSA